MQYFKSCYVWYGFLITCLSPGIAAGLMGTNRFIVRLSKVRPDCLTVLIDLPKGDITELHENVDSAVLVVHSHGENSHGNTWITSTVKEGKCSTTFRQWTSDTQNKDILAPEDEVWHTFLLVDTENEASTVPASMYETGWTFLQAADAEKDAVQLSTFCSSQDSPALSRVMHITGDQQTELQDLPFSCNVHSLYGKTLNVSVKLAPPFAFIDANKQIAGVEASVVKIAASHLGFHIRPVVEKHWVMYDPQTRSWDGIYANVRIRHFSTRTVVQYVHHPSVAAKTFKKPYIPDDRHAQVAAGKSKMGIGLVGVTMFMGQDFRLDFSSPMLDLTVVLLARKPMPLPPYSNLIRPFSAEVWILILFMLGAFSLAIFFIRLVYMKKTASHYAVLEAAVDSCLLTLSAICNQAIVDKKQPGRGYAFTLGLAFWIVSCQFLTSFYESNLRAHIIKTENTKPINSVEDLLETDTDLYVVRGSGTLDYFQVSEKPGRKEVARKIVRRGTIYTLQPDGTIPIDVMEKILQHGGSILTNVDYAAFEINRFETLFKQSFLRLGKDSSVMLHGCILLTPGLKHNDEIRMVTMRVVEAGLMQKIKNDFQSKLTTMQDESYGELNPFTLQHVASGFIATASGLLLSLFVFAREMKPHMSWRRFPRIG